MQHDIGPYFLKLHYVNGGRQHLQQFSINVTGNPGPGDPIFCATRGAGQEEVQSLVEDYVGKLKKCFTADTAFTDYSVYRKVTPSSEPIWLYTGIVASVVGTFTTGVNNIAGQFEVTFRTTLGGRWRWQIMESGIPSEVTVNPGELAAHPQLGDVTNFLVSLGNFVVGRDGGYPVQALRGLGKENDRLRRSWL